MSSPGRSSPRAWPRWRPAPPSGRSRSSTARPLADTPHIRTDATRFKQVLLNLLSNAVKYNREGGTITVTSEERPGGMLRISVADTGMGIAKDKQPQVFEPFNRLGAEGGGVEGIGLGLTITKEIVELLGGRIGFKSIEGKGSTFWIAFPMAEGKLRGQVDEAAGERDHEDTALGPSTVHRLVLYIDDSRVALRLMEEIVGRMPNVSMLSAPTAEKGLELAAEHRPDIILMDIALPGMDGYEALRALRASESTRTTPVVALTAKAMPKDVEKGLQAGFHDYVTKPFDIPRILSVIEEALESVPPAEADFASAPAAARIH